MEIIPNWHPAFVHFTVALLTVSTLLFLVSKLATNWRLEDQWLATAYWNLWIGTLLSVGTALAGWYAFNTVDHDTESHKVMLEHRNYALSALAVFVVLSVWAIFQYRSEKRPSAIFIIATLLGWGLVLTTAWHGGELVYRHGLGVMSMPEMGPHSHGEGAGDHGHGDDGHAHEGAASSGDHHQDSLGGDDHHGDMSVAPHAHGEPQDAPAAAAPAPEPQGMEGPAAAEPTQESAAGTPGQENAGAITPDVNPAAPAEPAGEAVQSPPGM